MRNILFIVFSFLLFSCNQSEKKQIPLNEYLIGTWELRQAIPIGEGASFSKWDLEFTDKKVYFTQGGIDIYGKEMIFATVPLDYTLDGKRVLIEHPEGEQIFQFLSDSSLTWEMPSIKEKVEVKLFKKQTDSKTAE